MTDLLISSRAHRTFNLRGPYWVSARTNRFTLWTMCVLAAGMAAVTVLRRLMAASAAGAFAATDCSVTYVTRGCGGRVGGFLDSELALEHQLAYAGLGLILLASAAAAFAAGPLTGRELESGTYKVMWTQSVTPAHWLKAQLVPPAVLVLAASSAVSGIGAWAGHTGPHGNYPVRWLEATTFYATGTLPVACSLLGLAVGALSGLWLGRALPAVVLAALAVPGFCLTISNVDGVLPRDFWIRQLAETGIALAAAALVMAIAFRILKRRAAA
ncbi:hypothetical protein [Streptomyces sp. NBC_01465]|uniref:hypothetical protein n=1 Tax=Streptomyces sp. NBC_01465 TaxID=2903878 RepID=UPI002E344EE6|nr:hypothetical protein [Streptomyces sp. NBC_01465]